MADKTRSRRLREKRKHLGSWAILLIVLAVFAVSTIGGIRLRQRNRSYEAREEALQKEITAEEDRAQEIEDLEFYAERYLDSDELPVHYFSDGDYYLVIPRYTEMKLSLYRNDIVTSSSALVYEEPDCRPFILQCNVSDIFPDAAIQLTYAGETVEFSPFISLKDGSVDVGERGLLLTDQP